MRKESQQLTDMRFAQAASCLTPKLYKRLVPFFSRFEQTAREIRLRLDRPLSVTCADAALSFALAICIDGALVRAKSNASSTV